MVDRIVCDSRAVEPGDLFVALRGQHLDGVVFAEDALARGAVVVVAEDVPKAGFNAAWIQVGDAREAMAVLAATFYADPSRELLVIGTTGTNGKTTV